MLLKLVKEHPEDAMINYQSAWSFDVLEKETEAIAYYKKSKEILLKIIADTSDDKSISTYNRAINFHTDKLDKVFK